MRTSSGLESALVCATGLIISHASSPLLLMSSFFLIKIILVTRSSCTWCFCCGGAMWCCLFAFCCYKSLCTYRALGQTCVTLFQDDRRPCWKVPPKTRMGERMHRGIKTIYKLVWPITYEDMHGRIVRWYWFWVIWSFNNIYPSLKTARWW